MTHERGTIPVGATHGRHCFPVVGSFRHLLVALCPVPLLALSAFERLEDSGSALSSRRLLRVVSAVASLCAALGTSASELRIRVLTNDALEQLAGLWALRIQKRKHLFR